MQRIRRDVLLAAMQRQSGYNPATTTNAARFQGLVLIDLARDAVRLRPKGPSLYIHHEDWYRAFLAAAGLNDETAPLFARLPYEHRQDTLVDYRAENVVRRIVKGPTPRLALNVRFWWPKQKEAASRYSFDDILSVPRLKVTYMRDITYRLLEYDDMIVYDEIHGVLGRPTTGLLGLLFKLIGEGRVVFSRMAMAADGAMVVYAKARKGPFKVVNTATVLPDGTADKGLPPGRSDLQRMEERLKQPLEIEYVPWPIPGK
jgi:hypothetical protein